MVEDKLNKWCEQLLDTGKGNNLINFKDKSSVEVLCPDFTTLFSKAEKSTCFEIFNLKTDDENLVKSKLSKNEFIEKYEGKIKANQALIYNQYQDPITVLKNIEKKARTHIEETVVNVAYVAFGFIHWFEDTDEKTKFKAPILLIPVSINIKSPVEPIRIQTQDEIILNPTFAFKLQNEFGIQLPLYTEGDDLFSYFENINNVIAKLKWVISFEAEIGIFSFLKINMYKDLKENSQIVLQNNNILSLLGENTNQQNLVTSQEFDIEKLHNVVDCDASQSNAVLMAKEGKSFVLQGPPGTGKSQTITNIIAECINDNKTVLFVSEKLAALNVVYDKLKKAGLEEFCLELHSHKANKKNVIGELCRTIMLPKSALADRAKNELQEKDNAEINLDNYTNELHKKNEVINLSLYELFEELSSFAEYKDVDYFIKKIENKSDEFYKLAIDTFSKIEKISEFIGNDYRDHFWYGINPNNYLYETKFIFKKYLLILESICKNFREVSNDLYKNYKIEIDNISQIITTLEFLNLKLKSNLITPNLLDKNVLEKTIDLLIKMQSLAKIILEENKIINEYFTGEIYNENGKELYNLLAKDYKSKIKRLFNGNYKNIIKKLRGISKGNKKVNYNTALKCLDALKIIQENTNIFLNLEQELPCRLGKDYIGINSNFELILCELKNLFDILNKNVNFETLKNLDIETFNSENENMLKVQKVLDYDIGEYSKLLADANSFFNFNIFNIDTKEFDELQSKFNMCVENFDSFETWIEFNNCLEELDSLGILDFYNYLIENGTKPNEIIGVFSKLFYSQWIDYIIRNSEVFSSLGRISHDKALETFIEKDKLYFEINKATIKQNVSEKRPVPEMIAPGSAASIILREGEKKRNQKNIRELLSSAGDFIQVVKPCFLMSPLSVSTYLEPNINFDVVIFDEASQIFPQDAAGAIYRGKQLIVVGDSKQMPPTNFFNAITNDTEEDEYNDATSFESILDLCSSTLPQCRLKWHYRSRYEQLISFSNQNYYGGELVTFPSSVTDKENIGVDYVFTNGTFDRKTKTNEEEAQKVVDLIYDHFENFPERSLGVVAFSISQQALIEKLLNKKRIENPSKEKYFSMHEEEPFFIKNLETVQGDERDTIIFSVAYAKDQSGKFYLNFGPLNKEGGERRLNVAVTRAKHNIKLVTSIHHYDIDLSRTESVGTEKLKNYLDYAENGTALNNSTAKEVDAINFDKLNFEKSVANFLREKGYEVETGVGLSSIKIDIAVKKPKSKDYAIAIECDGKTYNSFKTTRDRDRLRREVLSRMGWNYYRIWSLDWFKNNQTEKKRLLNFIDKNIAPDHKKQENNNENITFLENYSQINDIFKNYEKADEVKLARKNKDNILKTIKDILEVEAPLSEEWLLKRIAFMFGGRQKVTSVIQREFASLMWNCKENGIVRRDGFLYLMYKDIPFLRLPPKNDEPRPIEYISLEELSLGLEEVLKQNISITKDGLFKIIASQLGYSKVNQNVFNRLEIALQKLYKQITYINGIIKFNK